MSNSTLLLKKSLQFQTDEIVDIPDIPIQNAKFGILQLTAISSPMSQSIHEFIFMIDRSGSMTDICSDGKTKMQHILHTLENMIVYFKENNTTNAFINIFAFNNTTQEVVERTEINETNIHNIIEKIKTITPKSSTNIENALIAIKCAIDKIRYANPTHIISNIFMTDGKTTSGNTDNDYLYDLVDQNVTNSFIGFGIKHDSALLNSISNGHSSDYYFIDKLENSGLVYGEILHGILYKLIRNVSIHCSNCLIYDYKNNKWSDSLSVPDIASETNRDFHLISSTPDDSFVLFKTDTVADDFPLQDQFSIFKEDITGDLSKYVFRQRTLQLLFKVNQFTDLQNLHFKNSIFEDADLIETNRCIEQQENDLKNELTDFINEMKKYMDENNLKYDGFMKTLCDDIYISYRTFGTKYGAMYNCARLTSQGTQRAYTVSYTPDDFDINAPMPPPPPSLLRGQNNYSYRNNRSYQNVSVIQHDLSNTLDSPYLTQTATQLMRDISVGIDCDIFDNSTDDETQII